MEIKIDLAKTQQDLIEILDLQLANHRNYISAEQSNEHGFVTVKHNLELLTEMNKAAPQIIAKANGLNFIELFIILLLNFYVFILIKKSYYLI